MILERLSGWNEMQRRERLTASIEGRPVDRPPVSFYELNGLDEDPSGNDPFNIYAHPSWRPLIDLARERSDRIVMRTVPFKKKVVDSEAVAGVHGLPPDPLAEIMKRETWVDEEGRRFTRKTLDAGGRRLTAIQRRDPDLNTIWQVEHLLNDADDLDAFLEVPFPLFDEEPDPAPILEAEARLGDTGIVMLDTADALCLAADLFELGEFTILALTEQDRFHRLLEKFAAWLSPRVEAAARALPGRLWRVYGPEYACPPYLPPALFKDYVNGYDRALVESIQRHGGFARIHAHGNVRDVLDAVIDLGWDAIDPLEPPPQGNVTLSDVRARYGEGLTLFGNLEFSDMETLEPEAFREKVVQALSEGTRGPGTGIRAHALGVAHPAGGSRSGAPQLRGPPGDDRAVDASRVIAGSARSRPLSRRGSRIFHR